MEALVLAFNKHLVVLDRDLSFNKLHGELPDAITTETLIFM